MLKNYSLIKKGNCYLLRRLVYPRCKLLVDLEKNLPEIKRIKFLDECSVTEMAGVIKEIDSVIESLNPEQ